MISNSISGQLTFPVTGDDKASFDNFWVGNNQEVVATLKSTVTHAEPKMIYLYGPPGCGKSHLLFAVMRLASDNAVRTSYLSLSDAHINPDMLMAIDVTGLVCVDNTDAWAGDNTKERALFTLFEQVKHAGGQLLVTAKQAPDTSNFALRDLISRLSSGLIYAMHNLNDQQRFEALKMRASHRGLIISDEVLSFLVSRIARDTDELFSFLDKIDEASLVEKRKVTIPFLQTLLKREE